MTTLTPQEIAYQEAHIHDDRSKDVAVSHLLCLCLALAAVVMRFVSRRLGKVPLGADDWMVITAYVLGFGVAMGGLLGKKRDRKGLAEVEICSYYQV